MGQQRKWTATEIEKMQDLWGSKTIPQIAKSLNRSINAVKVKSTHMGLTAFKENSEYMNARQWSRTLGIDVHAITDFWIKKLGLKYKLIAPLGERKFTYIHIDVMLDFLKSHQEIWDSRRVEYLALGVEPEWLTSKRQEDLNIPKRKFQKYTEREDKILIDLFKTGKYTYAQIAERVNRSESSVEHRIARLDVFGNGKFIGDEHKKQQRKIVKDNYEKKVLLSRLANALLFERNQIAFDGYWQKDMCMCWDNIGGCTACESDCDSCTSFVRIPPQYCRLCCRKIINRNYQELCEKCKDMRKRNAQRKYAKTNKLIQLQMD